MLKIESNRKTAFTLAETLITVVILGIVAAILVPSLIKNQVENANRTKVKKAMASYEKAINYMIIENDIRETEALRELGQDNCQYAREYFKTVKDGSNNCIFKTADRVWWDITDITNPILILKNSQLDKSSTELRTLAKNLSDKTVFAMVGRFDDIGTLRINDNGFEQSQKNNLTNQKYVGKLWYFITQSTSVLTGFDRCNAENAATCTITKNGVSVTYNKVTTTTDTSVDVPKHCVYYRENNKRVCTGFTSSAPAGEYWISNTGTITEEEAKDLTGSLCTEANCIANGDYYEAARRRCQNIGGHLANLAELKIAYNNGKLNSGSFWASEENYVNHAYMMSGAGKVYNDMHKANHPEYKVICIGNN